MKKNSALFFSLSYAIVCITLFSTSSIAQTSAKKVIISKPTESQIAEGKALIAKSDCLACHKLDIKLVGPSYKDVAKKYPATEANYKILSQKIISGGKGNWGEIPMVAHANVTLTDAKKMVQYILSIK
ncbi:MAG: c-type cytochrome [Oligoflexus sp.]|jgi:cytochrome c|nr:c-type cytochrome [Pseudopedobacter sp.]